MTGAPSGIAIEIEIGLLGEGFEADTDFDPDFDPDPDPDFDFDFDFDFAARKLGSSASTWRLRGIWVTVGHPYGSLPFAATGMPNRGVR